MQSRLPPFWLSILLLTVLGNGVGYLLYTQKKKKSEEPKTVEAVQIRFRSEPPGARVVENDVTLGVTPFVQGFPASSLGETKTFRIVREGFRDVDVQRTLDAPSVEVFVSLTKESKPPRTTPEPETAAEPVVRRAIPPPPPSRARRRRARNRRTKPAPPPTENVARRLPEPERPANEPVPKLSAATRSEAERVPKVSGPAVPKLSEARGVPKVDSSAGIPKVGSSKAVPRVTAPKNVPKVRGTDTVPKLGARDGRSP